MRTSSLTSNSKRSTQKSGSPEQARAFRHAALDRASRGRAFVRASAGLPCGCASHPRARDLRSPAQQCLRLRIRFHSSFKQCSIVLAARMRPRFRKWPPFRRREGTARRVTRRSFVLHASLRRRGALRRTVRRSPSAPGRAFRSAVFARPPLGFAGFAAISDGLSGKAAGAPQRPHRQPAPGGRPILAARRSPDAARVRGLLAAPAGAGPLHTSRRNRFASLMGADNHRDIIL